MKIGRFALVLFSLNAALLFSVSQPVDAQTDWYEEDQKRRNDEYWDEEYELMRQRRQQQLQQQQPQRILSFEERMQSCAEETVKVVAQNFRLSQQLFAQGAYRSARAACVATEKKDYNTMWINDKRVIQYGVSQSGLSPAEAEQMFKKLAVIYIQNYGWTPPEYR